MRNARARKSTKWAAITAAAVAALAGVHSAGAASFTWDGEGVDFNWETATNWNPNGTPNDVADTITFNVADTAMTSAVSLGAPKTIGGALFNVAGAGNMTLGTSGQSLSLADGATLSRTGTKSTFINADLTLLGSATFNSTGGDAFNTGTIWINGNIAGSGGITFTGDATSDVYLFGSNAGYSGQMTVAGGRLYVSTQAAFGSNTTTVLAGGTIFTPATFETVTQNFNVTENSGIVSFGSQGVFTGTWTIAGGKTLTVNTGSGNYVGLSMVLTGAGNVLIQHDPDDANIAIVEGTTVATSNTMTGQFTVNAGGVNLAKTAGFDAISGSALQVNNTGSVRWLASNQVNDATQIILNGGTIAPNGFSDSAGTMKLTATSYIDFGATGASVLTLADSSGETWTGTSKLNLLAWGVDSADTLQIGTSAAGLTPAQLALLRFINPVGFGAGTYLAVIDSFGVLSPGAQVVELTAWNADADGNWVDAPNWSAGVPDTAEASVIFGGAINAPRTVTMTTPITVKDIVFNNADNKYTVVGSDTLTVTGANGISVTAGSHQISAPVKLVANASFTMNSGTALTLGTVDANGNSVIVGGAGNLTTGNISNAVWVWMIGEGNTVTLGDLALSGKYLVGDGVGLHGSGNYTVGNIGGGTEVTVFSPVSTSTNIIGNISNITGVVTLRGGGSITTGDITNVQGLNIYENGDRTVGNVTNTNGAAITTTGLGVRNFGVITNTGAVAFDGITQGSIGGLSSVPSLTLINASNVTLNGNNTGYTGNTTVHGGSTLTVGHNNALGTTGTLSIGQAGQGTIRATTSGITISNPLLITSMRIAGSQDITFNGNWAYHVEGTPSDINVTNTGVTTFNGGHTNPNPNNQTLHLSGTNANVVFNGPITYILGANQNSPFEVGNVNAFSGMVTFNAANDVRSSQMRFGLNTALNNFTVGVGHDNAFQLATGAGALGIISNDGVTWTAVGGNHFVHKLARFNNTTFTGSNVLDFDGAVANSLKMDNQANQSTATAKTFTTNTTGTGRVRTRGLTAQTPATTSLTLKGTGKLEVYGASTGTGYGGTTTIGDGTDSPTFLANNTGTGSATGSGAILVNVGGTLGGTGRVGTAAGVVINGNLSPGDLSAGVASSFSNGAVNGTLEIGAALTLANTSTLTIDLGAKTVTTPDTINSYDQVNVTLGGASSAVTNNGANLSILLNNGFSPDIGDVFYILNRTDTSSTLTGNFAQGSTVSFGSGMFATIIYDAHWVSQGSVSNALAGGNDVALLVTVPEPTSLGLMALGATGLLARRRRRNPSIER